MVLHVLGDRILFSGPTGARLFPQLQQARGRRAGLHEGRRPDLRHDLVMHGHLVHGIGRGPQRFYDPGKTLSGLGYGYDGFHTAPLKRH